jgi:cyclopropane fatty-acyl-phospholipid synthase-like methyltransferase
MLFNSPLHTVKADHIIEQFNLKPGSYVLDAGCGEGEFLIRVAERYEIKGFGVDINKFLIDRAQDKANTRIKAGNVVFTAQDAPNYLNEKKLFDLIICMGSDSIFGGYEAAIQKLKLSLVPNGLLFIGTIFWKQKPADEYLQLMGGENPYFDHANTIDKAIKQGFIPLYICRSNDDEWDDFESSTSQRKYLEAIKQPSTLEAAKQIEKVMAWQKGYLKWGIDTMGFGFYLLLNT